MTKYSNPFLKDFRRKAFDAKVKALNALFPDASEEYIRRCAWQGARRVQKP